MTKYQILLAVYKYLEEDFRSDSGKSSGYTGFLSSADPYLWTEGKTADPQCYKDFISIMNDIMDGNECTSEEAMEYAKKYLSVLNEKKNGELEEAVDVFSRCTEEKWLEIASELTSDKTRRYKCPCCGYYTLTESGQWEICDVCFWEDDPIQAASPDLEAGANNMSLNQARKNFEKYGAVDEKSVPFVRMPTAEEVSGIARELNDYDA